MQTDTLIERFSDAIVRYYCGEKVIFATCVFENPPLLVADDGVSMRANLRLISVNAGISGRVALQFARVFFADGTSTPPIPCVEVGAQRELVPGESAIPVYAQECTPESFKPFPFDVSVQSVDADVRQLLANIVDIQVRGTVSVTRATDTPDASNLQHEPPNLGAVARVIRRQHKKGNR